MGHNYFTSSQVMPVFSLYGSATSENYILCNIWISFLDRFAGVSKITIPGGLLYQVSAFENSNGYREAAIDFQLAFC